MRHRRIEAEAADENLVAARRVERHRHFAAGWIVEQYSAWPTRTGTRTVVGETAMASSPMILCVSWIILVSSSL